MLGCRGSVGRAVGGIVMGGNELMLMPLHITRAIGMCKALDSWRPQVILFQTDKGKFASPFLD